MVVAHYLSKIHKETLDCNECSDLDIKTGLGIIFTPIIILLSMHFIYSYSSWMNFQIPTIFPIVITMLFFFVIIIALKNYYIKQKPNCSTLMPLLFGMFGVILLSFPASAVLNWFVQPDEWVQFYLFAEPTKTIEMRPEVIVYVIALSLAATGIWALTARMLSTKTKYKDAALFGSGINLAIVFGQFTDASATFIAIDYYSYWEKHVVPSFLIDVLDSAAVMFLLKAVALIFAIYLLDIMLRTELKQHKQIIPLIKIAVLVLGLAPGTRDVLRLAMGV
jgi:uncharacterized membrane protein